MEDDESREDTGSRGASECWVVPRLENVRKVKLLLVILDCSGLGRRGFGKTVNRRESLTLLAVLYASMSWWEGEGVLVHGTERRGCTS